MSWMKLASEIQYLADLERASPVATGVDLDDMNSDRAAAILLGTVLHWHDRLGWASGDGINGPPEPSAVETLSRCFQRHSSGGKGWHGTIPLPEHWGPLTVLKIALLRHQAGDDGGRIARDLVRTYPEKRINYGRQGLNRIYHRILKADGGTKIDVLYGSKATRSFHDDEDKKGSVLVQLAGPWYPSGWLL